MAGLNPEAGGSARLLRGIAVGVTLAAAALLATAARLATEPVVTAIPALGWFGPGKVGLLRMQRLDKQGRPPAGTERLARTALDGQPLAFEPFYAAALARFEPEQGGPDSVATLLREAIRRNPRSRDSRVLLVRHAVARKDLGTAIDQLAVLKRLSGGMVDGLMVAIGKALTSEQQADAALAALRNHPELLPAFLAGFGLDQKPSGLVVRVVRGLPHSALAAERTRRAATDLMVRAGAYAQARELWGRGAGSGLLNDPTFTERALPPPFGWALEEDETGVAERLAGGGAEVIYYGREPGPLATQLLTLPPGSYRATVRYRPQGGMAGAIGLSITCAGTQNVLGAVPFDGEEGGERTAQLPFTVPEGCGGQQLALEGRALETRDPQTITVRDVTIRRDTGS